MPKPVFAEDFRHRDGLLARILRDSKILLAFGHPARYSEGRSEILYIASYLAGNASEDKLSVVLWLTFDWFVFTKGRFLCVARACVLLQ